MHEFIRKTWFVTTVFAATAAAPLAAIATGPDFHFPWLGISIAMVTTPLIWLWLVGRRPRPKLGWGAFAGAICFLLFALLQIIPVALVLAAKPPSGEGGFGALLYFILAPLLLTVAVLLGAPVGTIIVLLQRRWPRLGDWSEWEHSGSVAVTVAAPDPDLDLLEAIRKTLVATMMFVVPLAAVALLAGGLLWHFVVNVLVVTPPIWWWLVGRRARPGGGQGAFAGAVCLVLAFHLPFTFNLGAMSNGQRPDALLTAGFGAAFIIAMAIPGAALGSMVVHLQRRWSN